MSFVGVLTANCTTMVQKRNSLFLINVRTQPGEESSDTDVSDQSLALCSISCTRYHTLTRAQSRA